MYETLYEKYKTYSDKELKKITCANGYTGAAEQIALQLLLEYKEDTDTSKHEKDVVYCINCGAKCPGEAKFCMKCGFKVVKKEQVEREYMRNADVAINPAYKKLGGWLAFFAYGHLVAGVLIVIGAVMVISMNIKIANEFSQYGISLGDVLQLGVTLIIAFCGVLSAYCFILSSMIRKRNCRFLHFYEMVMMIGCGIVVALMIYQKMKGAEIAPKDVRYLLWGVIMFVVWMRYFIKSERVCTYLGSDEYLERSIIYRCFHKNRG